MQSRKRIWLSEVAAVIGGPGVRAQLRLGVPVESGVCSIHFAFRMAENQDMDEPAKGIFSKKLVEPAEEHAIRCRAYELYEQGGRGDGHALDDWLRAEREIKGSRSWRISAVTK